LDYKKYTALISIILVSVFSIFVFVYERYAYHEAQDNIEQHARVIANSLWNFNPLVASEYLSIACKLNNYQSVVVVNNKGGIFHKSVGEPPNMLEKLFILLHIIPSVQLTTGIVYNGKLIGAIDAIWKCNTIYKELLVLFIIILFFLILQLYVGLLSSNQVLEERVLKRTTELSILNDSLQLEIIDHQQAKKALSQSEERYRLIAENATDVIWITDMNFKFTYLSPSIYPLRGYTVEEAMKQTFEEVALPESFENVRSLYNETLKLIESGDEEGLNPVEFEIQQFCKDGSVIWTSNNTRIITNSHNQPVSILGITHDITGRKKAEEEKIRLETQLQQAQKIESIGTLAGGIAHDFNNILFPVLGHTEMLLHDIPDDNPIHKDLKKIYAGANRAKELVKQILTFSRQEPSELKLIKIQPLIKEVLKLLRATIPTTIGIKQDISSDCGIIKADSTQIHQIVMNLATNAYHAMEESGGELQITLKEVNFKEHDLINPDMTPGKFACLTIADTGVGIEQELIDKIFDPFFTTKETGKGTGMGLSVVHGIVKSMHGAIQVYSKPDKGTEFHVYLPLVEGLKEQKATDTIALNQAGTEHILLVDDEEAILTMEKQMLERLGYSVTSCSNSIEALEAFRVNPNKFDMVITDMAMANMSGDMLSAELNIIRPDIPVLLCTGFSETMPEEKAESLGINGFLLKPIVMNDLSHKIREVLDNNKTKIEN